MSELALAVVSEEITPDEAKPVLRALDEWLRNKWKALEEMEEELRGWRTDEGSFLRKAGAR